MEQLPFTLSWTALLNCSAENKIIPSDRPLSVISSKWRSIGEFFGAFDAAYLLSSSTKNDYSLGISLSFRVVSPNLSSLTALRISPKQSIVVALQS